jgi:ATP-dependent RNA helicase SUPV3L1/SUV3
MLNAAVTQYKLNDEGQILYQEHPTNPLPGVPVAHLRKGKAIMEPDFGLIDSNIADGLDRAAVKAAIGEWLKGHLARVLEPLVALSAIDEKADAPVRGICFQVHEAMGIVPREQIEDLIALLTPESRQQLRAKQVRLGPILVFIPALNKPAAVRLRGVLWSLYNDQALPPKLPNDGVMSFKIEPGKINHNYYRAIGYPVYGTRAIRIDMLDRVINLIYEGAKEGKFRAQHQMAEWLGCGIEDLYAVLNAMGHRKIEAPVEVKSEEAATQGKPQEAVPTEVLTAETAPQVKAPQAKPELAMFYLKKGKAFERPQRKERPSGDKKKQGGKFKHKKSEKDNVRVMQAGPKPKIEDSPFAVLQHLKAKKDAS